MSENPYEPPLSSVSLSEGYGAARDLSSYAGLTVLMLVINLIYYAVKIVQNYLVAEGVITVRHLQNGVENFSMPSYVLTAITAVAVCVWTYHAMVNSWAIARLNPNMTPKQAIIYYFIPAANLWKPYEGMAEIWMHTFGVKASRSIVLCWWWCCIIGVFSYQRDRPFISEPSLFRVEHYLSDVMLLIAAVCLIRIIRAVTKNHSARLADSQ